MNNTTSFTPTRLNLFACVSKPLRGEITIPGDKSISHRALILGAIANGKTKITGFLQSADCIATMHALQNMGVNIEIVGNSVCVHGVGKYGLQAPQTVINCENSATTMRLLAGILVGQNFSCELTGDRSLQRRPMDRIVRPLKQMGADIIATDDKPPLRINGVNSLLGINYEMPIASAQVKSCLMFAGMYAESDTIIHDPGHTRDHTERMLTAFCYPILKSDSEIIIKSKGECVACDLKIPGDISSAAFFIVAATLVEGSALLIRDVGINPGRIGIIKILQLMGASIEILNKRLYGEEPVADLLVKSAKLEGIDIPMSLVPAALDEFPIIFIAAAYAQGQTLLHGAKELRYKESDRIKSMITGLKTLGIDAHELEDGVYIRGGEIQGGVVDSFDDHRVAMSFAIAGLVAKQPITIKNSESYSTSFPNFLELMNKLQINISVN